VKATEVTAGLAESNGSLLLGVWHDSLHVICGWLPVHWDQVRAQRLVTSMGKLYLFYIAHKILSSAIKLPLKGRRKSKCWVIVWTGGGGDWYLWLLCFNTRSAWQRLPVLICPKAPGWFVMPVLVVVVLFCIQRRLSIVSCSYMSSVLWHCWLGVRKSARLVKIEWWGVCVVIHLERGVECLHMVQLMPLHPESSSSLASFKSWLVLPF